MPDRRCIECSTPIAECMGSVLMRDIAAAQAGAISYTQVREHCGLCTLKHILADDCVEYLTCLEKTGGSDGE